MEYRAEYIASTNPVFTYWRCISIVAELTESPVKKEAYITSLYFVE
jgi:hypothetical protein